MNIRQATKNDKERILDFCKNTFSWGDYIPNVWDYWVNEGNLLIIHENRSPIGMCHASISKNNKQVWIEGIRVNSKFRRQGCATKLVNEAEKIAKQNRCNVAYMLIESNNKNSLALVRSLHYEQFERWNFYSLLPLIKNVNNNIKFANYDKKSPSSLFSGSFFYVKSWRWLPLDYVSLHSLIKENRIIYYENSNTCEGLAIITDSEHFEKTMIVTIINGSINELTKILYYIQNFAYKNNYKRIQILTKLQTMPKNKDLENRLVFYLMKKKI